MSTSSTQVKKKAARLAKAILVTGGGRGIGAAISLALADRGLPVFINFRSDSASAEEACTAVKAAGGEAFPVCADISNPDAVKDMFAEIRKQGYWVHTLVNNAGIVKDNLVAMMSHDSWHEVINTNLDSAFYCTRAALTTMMVRKSGQIVNVSSVSAIRGQIGQANYSAAKAGLLALTRTLAREVGRYGIRVNAVAPGFIETDMLAGLQETDKGSSLLEASRNFIALERFGSPNEVAQTVSFLCSKSASYVTGHVLVVDGGLSV